MRAPHKSAGFTLIEVLLAVAILSLISSMVYASFVPSLETIQIVESRRALYRRGRIVLRRMEDEIRSAFLGVYTASNRRGCEIDERDCPYFFIGENSGDEDELRFTTLAGRPKSSLVQADQLWVRYAVERDEDSRELVLQREERPIHEGDFHHDTKPRLSPLFPNIKQFNLRYVNRGTTNDFLEEWDSTRGLDENQSHSLPRAVEVTIEFGDEDGNVIKLSSLIEIPGSTPPDEKKTQQQQQQPQ